MKSTKRPSNLARKRSSKKKSEDNLTERITIRFSQEEIKEIKEKSERLGLKPSAFCRPAILRRKIPDHSTTTLEMVRVLIAILNNLNQMAKYVNINQVMDEKTRSEIEYLASTARELKECVINHIDYE